MLIHIQYLGDFIHFSNYSHILMLVPRLRSNIVFQYSLRTWGITTGITTTFCKSLRGHSFLMATCHVSKNVLLERTTGRLLRSSIANISFMILPSSRSTFYIHKILFLVENG